MSMPQPLPRILTSQEIVPTMRRVISKCNAIRDEIIRNNTPSTATFDTVMRPYVEVENAVTGEINMIYMLQYAAPDMATQEAFNQARKLLGEAEAFWATQEDFFQLLQASQDKSEDLDPESKLLIHQELLDYKQSGRGLLSRSSLEQYLKEDTKIKDIASQLLRNISQENGGLWFTEEELDGVLPEDLARWDNGTERLYLGKKFVPFANGGTATILAYAHSSETRKSMFFGNNMRLRENAPLFEYLVKHRASQAHFLGYASHAAFVLERRMAKTTNWVESFLNKLRSALIPRGREELNVLQHRRLQDLKERGELREEEAQHFPPWDQLYYQRLVEQELQIDQSKISEFFPLERTAIAMLGIFASCLGLRFDPIPVQELRVDVIWHANVRVFSVWEGEGNGSGFIGYLYFDLLWRENKYRGNHNVNIECGYLKVDGSRHYPATILMCSFPTPTPTSCPLLKHREVVTLFHEMGHAIHDLLSQTRYARFHGTRGPRDFVEMPSVMLENWCWMKDVLKELSCHYTTLNVDYLRRWQSQHPGVPNPPKEIPDELVDSLVRHRFLNRGLYHLNQLSVSMFDLKVYGLSTKQEIADLNIQSLWYDIREDVEGFDFSECRNGFEFATYPHITVGMDAGYYAYLCCTALAQDLFHSVFVKDPRNRNAWAKYRREILEWGGSQEDTLKMLENFLGRPPNLDALVEGLSRAYAV